MKRLLVLAPCALACTPYSERPLPALDEGPSKVALLLHVPHAGTPEGVTGVWLPADETMMRDGDGRLYEYAFIYPRTFDELGWSEGDFTHRDDSPGRLRVPVGAIFEWGGEGWNELDDRGELLRAGPFADLRFPGPPDDCTGKHTCIDQRGYCQVPCDHTPTLRAPTEPAPPRLAKCDADGEENLVAGSPLTRCSADAPRSCPIDQRTRPDNSCANHGRACADPWTEPPIGPTVRFVSATAAPGGDGSELRPWTLDHALMTAGPNTALILDAGDHSARPYFSLPSLTLRGRCAGMTRVAITSFGARDGSVLTLEGLHLVFTAGRDTPAYVENVRMTGVAISGGGRLIVSGPSAMEDIVVRGPLTDLQLQGEIVVTDIDQRGGRLRAWRSALTLTGARIEGQLSISEASTATVSGVRVYPPSEVSAILIESSNVTITDAIALGGKVGVRATPQSFVRISRMQIEHSVSSGIELGSGVGLVAEDLIVAGSAGDGLVLEGTATASITRAALFEVDQSAVKAGTLAQDIPYFYARDLIIDQTGSHGLELDAHVDVARARVENTMRSGIRLAVEIDAEADGERTATLAEIIVDEARSTGIDVEPKGDRSIVVKLDHAVIANGTSGLQVRAGRATVRAEDFEVARMTDLPGCTADDCRGAAVILEPRVTGVRLDTFAFHNVAAGIVFADGARIDMDDGYIEAPICYLGPVQSDWRDEWSDVHVVCGEVDEL